MFTLSTLLNYDNIVIQCHNNPDADTIASGFAVYTYLKSYGKTARIIYSGNAEITKANLLEMIDSLSIPIKYVRSISSELPHIETLVLVDCQYGERNVEKFTADNIFVIDHHVEVNAGYSGIIRQLGSCSTVVWDLLNGEMFDFKKAPAVATALYYGLFTDTGGLEEIAHPLDKDMRDRLKFNPHIVKRLRNNNLTLSELELAGEAFKRNITNRDLGYAIFHAEPCDPNILGFISDLALQTEGVDVCVVYNENNDGYKLSVRTCVREVMADEFVRFLTTGVGNGGGHKQKAGGFIGKSALSSNIEEFIEQRVQEYFRSYDVVIAGEHSLDISLMKKYRKNNLNVYYAKTIDIFKKGTPFIVRTLEGDAETEAADDIYLMVGIEGEVYPIKAEKWNNSYQDIVGGFNCDFEYPPSVINRITAESVKIMGFAKPCVSTGEVHIYAMPLSRNTKVFTAWNEDGYMAGKPGDYIAVRADDRNDVYIIREDIFYKTYEKSN